MEAARATSKSSRRVSVRCRDARTRHCAHACGSPQHGLRWGMATAHRTAVWSSTPPRPCASARDSPSSAPASAV
eukprot:2674520-Prymnesium_polylepis.2